LRYNPTFVVTFDLANYPKRIAEVLAKAGPEDRPGERLMPLAFGPCVSPASRDLLRSLDTADLFAPSQVAADDYAAAARSGLFVYLSCMDDAHAIAQEIHTATGSYWHGILHRMEPDFSNARYWFRRVGRHEIFPALRAAAAALAGEDIPEFRNAAQWDPFAFIDLCEQEGGSGSGKRAKALERVQLAEWQLLFDFCCRRALGIPWGK
jgi:hypothetical protein